ncbi:Ger(x)C family spore germination C-terminal domain-containing protein [Virgibacillus halophilus]|uniref:Ger(X)C family spore germination C-terminal domain-containing protein n=1 Tax=Tigheibacillus halophilus TaxID=361280 RepID=A0ABU5C8M8_9BACI|nr:Ger(x)C family spore germination C-terminal domain-containing protein [Virgibacillus halophilus]
MLWKKEYRKRLKHLWKGLSQRAKKELNADVFGFGTYLYNHDYHHWEKHLKPNWEQGRKLFANGQVDVSVKTILRSFGTTDRTKVLHKN